MNRRELLTTTGKAALGLAALSLIPGSVAASPNEVSPDLGYGRSPLLDLPLTTFQPGNPEWEAQHRRFQWLSNPSTYANHFNENPTFPVFYHQLERLDVLPHERLFPTYRASWRISDPRYPELHNVFFHAHVQEQTLNEDDDETMLFRGYVGLAGTLILGSTQGFQVTSADYKHFWSWSLPQQMFRYAQHELWSTGVISYGE